MYSEVVAIDIGERRVKKKAQEKDVGLLVWVEEKLPPSKVKLQLPREVDGLILDVNEGSIELAVSYELTVISGL